MLEHAHISCMRYRHAHQSPDNAQSIAAKRFVRIRVTAYVTCVCVWPAWRAFDVAER